MSDVLSILLAVFVFIGIGYAAGRAKILEPSQNRIFSHFVFYVSMPCLVLALFGGQDVLKDISLGLLALNVIPLAGLAAFIWLYHRNSRVSGEMVALAALAALMPNSAFVGLPLADLLFGKDGTKFASVISSLHLMFSLLIVIPLVNIVSKKKRNDGANAVKEFLLHPLILALLLGILLNASRTMLPAVLESPLQGIGASTTPLALFSIGLFMAGVKTSIKETRTALVLSVFRIIPYSLLMFLLAPFFGVTGIALAVSLLLSMTPIAVIGFVTAVEYGLDSEAMAVSLLITALFLPVPVYLVSKMMGA